ncbi:MAG: hypothetical protein R8M46_03240 [Ghiorsea sp.]
MIEQVIVTDAFLNLEGKFILNPALRDYEAKLLGMKHSEENFTQPVTPLAWLAKEKHVTSASILALVATNLPQSCKQFWVASPYHARLTRSTLRVMPDILLDRSEALMEKICQAINPFVKEDGLQLFIVGQSLVLASDKVWDVESADFAQVSGGLMPDKLPDGADAGYWMRLLSEIQMTLHQHQITTDNGLLIHGLWFWGKSEQAQLADVKLELMEPIATRSLELKSVLQALDKERDATMIVSEAEHLPMLVKPNMPYPKQWLLLGDGKAIKCTQSTLLSWKHGIKARKWKGID